MVERKSLQETIILIMTVLAGLAAMVSAAVDVLDFLDNQQNEPLPAITEACGLETFFCRPEGH